MGSDSHVGAGSTLISDTITRILECGVHTQTHIQSAHNPSPPPYSSLSSPQELLMTSKAKSYILSVDMAHAIHPNYMSKHSKEHAPIMNRGVVIKHNSNMRYATNTITAFIMRELAKRVGHGDGHGIGDGYGSGHGVPIQEYMVRNDCPCGSTIGPT
ncbi:hypothetical protein EON65_38815 [archaeon]|nr:MAG: hypothetical protein EON65_38815 [archaeon]